MFLSNFRNADLRLLIAVLHSSLNHGLRLIDLVEDFGIHFSEMSCNAEVKADISSSVLNFSGVSCSWHKVVNVSQFFFFKFHRHCCSLSDDSISLIKIGK